MGLDITAYSRLQFLRRRAGDDNDDYDWSGHECSLWIEPAFVAQADGMQEGIYRFGEKFDFRAGSYGGYNHWRDQLCVMTHGVPAQTLWDKPANYPAFSELINFSDCEGLIGPKTSGKLLHDFEAHLDKAERMDPPYFLASYLEWVDAFRLAANGGAIKFH
jgi:hypothetical protein